jgi:hypothetical protein
MFLLGWRRASEQLADVKKTQTGVVNDRFHISNVQHLQSQGWKRKGNWRRPRCVHRFFYQVHRHDLSQCRYCSSCLLEANHCRSNALLYRVLNRLCRLSILRRTLQGRIWGVYEDVSIRKTGLFLTNVQSFGTSDQYLLWNFLCWQCHVAHGKDG